MLVPFKKARAQHLKVGEAGEKAARKLLESKHMDILAQNFKCDAGEIDIVARDGDTLAFVEVKTRMKRAGIRPVEGLSGKQKSRIYRAALRYMKEIENPRVVYRFDLVEVVLTGWGVDEIRHWQSHFKGSETYKFRKGAY